MGKWFSNENKRMLKEHGIDNDFPWGAIEQIHPIGDFHIVEYIDNDDGSMFHPYVNRKDTHHSVDNFDVALLIAMEYKYEGLNSQFAYFAAKMLGIKEVE